jgi:programmed cell death 8 (apoptosis-inducing factor)
MFWSDLGPNVGYEAIGLIDASLPTVAVFMKTPPSEKNPREEDPEKENVEENKEKKNPEEKEGSTDNTEKPELVEKVSAKPNVVSKEKEDEDFSKGVVFYMRDGHIVGILLWNVFNRINVARRVLMMDKKFDDLNEVAKLFDIYEQQN